LTVYRIVWNRMKTSSEYRRTLFDKLGPEAADLFKIGSWMPVPLTAGVITGCALAIRAGLMPPGIVLSALVGGLLAGALTALVVLIASRGAGSAFGSFLQPTDNHTPYEQQYSYEDSLLMRGDVAGALASFEQIIAVAPNEAQPRLRAAEVCMKSGMLEKAELFLRGVQRLPQVAPKDDVYASNRLVDLYRAWPGNETKAWRELRRLIDTYSDTDVAVRAREGLATLKRQA
jgi:tetratricopeptide repeat protein